MSKNQVKSVAVYSIVTRIIYTPQSPTTSTLSTSAQPISFMITGDAPGEITKKIITSNPKTENDSPLKSTVLLASHHGATTADSNKQDWFEAVSPEYVIFSHGDSESYWHPHPIAVEQALKLSKTLTDPPHVLFYGFRTEKDSKPEDKNKIANNLCEYWHTFAQLFSKYRNLGYRLLLTNKAVFSTYTQGDIPFKIYSNNSLEFSWTKKPGEIKADGTNGDKKSVINAYLQGTKLAEMVMDLYFDAQTDLAEEFLN